MNKRLFGVAMALCVLLTLIPPGAFAAAGDCGLTVLKAQKLTPGTTFDPDTAEEVTGNVKPGDIVVLTIGLKNNGGAAMKINAFGLKLPYDNTKVTPYTGAAPFAEKPYQLSPELTNWMLAVNDTGADFRASAMSMTACDIPSGAETALFHLAFSVKADAPEGVAAFAFDTQTADVIHSDGSHPNLNIQPYSLTIDAGAGIRVTFRPNGEASAVTDLSQVAPGSELTVNVEQEAPSDDFRTVRVFCAVYDRDGKMVHLRGWTADVSDPLHIVASGKIRIPENVSPGEIRVFALSENLVPLRAPVILA